MYDYILGVGIISTIFTLAINIAHRAWTHRKSARDIRVLTATVEKHMYDSETYRRMACHWCGKYPIPPLK